MIRNKIITGILAITFVLAFSGTSMAATDSGIKLIEGTETSTSESAAASDNTGNDTSVSEIRIINTVADDSDADTATDTAEDTAEESADSSSEAGETEETANESVGQRAVEFAKQFLGGRYRYSGTSLTNGTDCSGFTMSVYKNFGISLPHSSRSQRSVGQKVASIQEAKAGDIVCYSGHVALYMGDGRVIHALNEKKGITISDASYNRIVDIRRVA